MSAAHDAHADASAGHHDAHDHFDNEPATELGADEPRTPNWVPYLGLALFFSAGVAMMVCSGEDKPTADKPATAGVVQAAPPPTPQGQPMPQARPAMIQPGQAGQPGQPANNPLQQISPEQREQIQKLIEQQRQRQGGAAPGTPPGGAAVVPPGTPPGGVPVRPPQPVPQGQPAHQ